MTDHIINFVLLCEGSSDQELVRHLQTLLVRHGASEAIGTADYRKGTVEEKLARILVEGASVDVAFVHRDADGRDHRPRAAEVATGCARAAFPLPCIPVVPVQMTESWLLADEGELRSVVGRPSGKSALNLPAISKIEQTHNAKKVLRDALVKASEKSGRRLEQERKQFNVRRRTLLQRLDVSGPVATLPSWQRLEAEVANLVKALG